MEPHGARSPGTKSPPLCGSSPQLVPHSLVEFILQLGNTPKESLNSFLCIWKETGIPSLCPSVEQKCPGQESWAGCHLRAPNWESACEE